MGADGLHDSLVLLPDPPEGGANPGGIDPGYYTRNGLVQLLRDFADEPAIIRWLADMLEN